jgi:two-component system, OmpR family, sensor histidine kinase KdpD
MNHKRSDPDALLRRVQAEEARHKRGNLRVFFGFAPGVGKTYRMLQVARDLVIDQKLDVVVGLVEDHKRRETAQLDCIRFPWKIGGTFSLSA